MAEVVKPNLAPKTYDKYEMFARLYIAPASGLDGSTSSRRARSGTVASTNSASNASAALRARTPGGQKVHSGAVRSANAAARSSQHGPSRTLRDTLRAALAHAVTEDELIARNPAALVRPRGATRARKVRAWSVAEACQFLDSARAAHDPL